MKVLQVMAGRHHGGAETAFVDTVIALYKSGLQQEIIVRKNAACSELLKSHNIPVLELSFRKFMDFTTRKLISSKIKQFKPDIVQTWMNRASSFCPVGEFIHIGWFGGYYQAKNYKNCQYLVGVTPDICRHQQTIGWPKSKVKVLRTFSHQKRSPPLERELFKTPKNAPLLLALARLHSKKGLDVLLKAIVQIPEAYLWIAGDGPLELQLKELTNTLGLNERVRFLGWRNDRAALLATADICVFPSRYEPFGTVMAEAWAHQIPLIAAASQGPKAHIIHEVNGILTAIDDVAGLTTAIQRVINQPELKARLVQGGLETFNKDFTEQAVVNSYKIFYQQILDHSCP
ncbi:MAG: glycosyltransferase [Alphaproteobacteria bacterium]|nr:glycosyltransferase [Alphaproteobacteria bacterium]